MKSKLLFGDLILSTYAASGTDEPIERFYASMFSTFFSQTDSQPGTATVYALIRGKRAVPRKLLKCYRDAENPRCPQKLREDLEALADCCFLGATRCNALRKSLETFLMTLPSADAEDLSNIMCSKELIHMWTCLTWYAMCGGYHG